MSNDERRTRGVRFCRGTRFALLSTVEGAQLNVAETFQLAHRCTLGDNERNPQILSG
jgi:hypothetical protein